MKYWPNGLPNPVDTGMTERPLMLSPTLCDMADTISGLGLSRSTGIVLSVVLTVSGLAREQQGAVSPAPTFCILG
jgi:hypothetical protein